MNKSELTEKLAKRLNIQINEAKTFVGIILNTMYETLANGDDIQLRGYFSFTIREHEGYAGVNPKTGEKVQVKPKKLPYFKPSPILSAKLNEKSSKVDLE